MKVLLRNPRREVDVVGPRKVRALLTHWNWTASLIW